MQQKKWLLTFVISAFVLLAAGLGVNAEEKQTESEMTVEYESFNDILEEVQTETGDMLYLSSIEAVDGIYLALYLDSETLQETIEAEGYSVSPRIVVSVEKEVVVYYNSFDEIPDTMFYEEFNDGYRTWMKGTLNLISVDKSGSGYRVVYRGSLVGHI